MWASMVRRAAPLVLVLAVAGLGVGFAGVSKDQRRSFGTFKELHRGNSNFGLLQVLQENGGVRRLYLNDYLTQNTYDANRRAFEVTDPGRHLHVPLLLSPYSFTIYRGS